LKRNYHSIIWPALAVIILDQISKWAIMGFLRVNESFPVSDFFNLVHIRNRGMAFGLMNRPQADFGIYLITGVSLVAVILLLVWCFKLGKEEARLTSGLSLIIGGALGNLVDRVRYGEVVDFLDFYLGTYHWPAFNVADSAITVGTFWVAGYIIFQQRGSPGPKSADG